MKILSITSLVFTATLLSACSSQPEVSQAVPFQCEVEEGVTLVKRVVPVTYIGTDKAQLEQAGQVYSLSLTPAASGAKYISEDQQTMLWTQGAEAMITIDGAKYLNCQEQELTDI